jgi:hypothetical protein
METPEKEVISSEPQPIEFNAILNPNGDWQIKCALLSSPELRIMMKGYMDDLHDTVKILLAQQAMGPKPKIHKPSSFMDGIRNLKR